MEATIHTSKGDIKVELFPDKTPVTVNNFKGLATGEREWQNPATGLKSNEPLYDGCLLYTSPSPRDKRQSRMPSSA